MTEQSAMIGQTLKLRLASQAGYRFNVEILDVEPGFVKMRFLDGDRRTTYMPLHQIVELELLRDPNDEPEEEDDSDPLLLASGH